MDQSNIIYNKGTNQCMIRYPIRNKDDKIKQFDISDNCVRDMYPPSMIKRAKDFNVRAIEYF